MIRNATFASFLAVWAVNSYGVYRMVHGWGTASWKETYNWISSVLVFDTLPLLAIAAGVLGFVGRDKERLKFRIIGAAMIGATIVVGMIFGWQIFTVPIIELINKYS